MYFISTSDPSFPASQQCWAGRTRQISDLLNLEFRARKLAAFKKTHLTDFPHFTDASFQLHPTGICWSTDVRKMLATQAKMAWLEMSNNATTAMLVVSMHWFKQSRDDGHSSTLNYKAIYLSPQPFTPRTSLSLMAALSLTLCRLWISLGTQIQIQL